MYQLTRIELLLRYLIGARQGSKESNHPFPSLKSLNKSGYFSKVIVHNSERSKNRTVDWCIVLYVYEHNTHFALCPLSSLPFPLPKKGDNPTHPHSNPVESLFEKTETPPLK